MPNRRLVKIGENTPLPTISQFLNEMAIRQHEEVVRLKREALSGTLPDPTVPEEHHETLTPDPWQLHPVRRKKAPKKPAAKKRKTPAARSAKPKAKARRAVPAAKKSRTSKSNKKKSTQKTR